MPRIHDRTFRVRYYECDLYGELRSAGYLRLMQEAAFDASAAAGYARRLLDLPAMRRWYEDALREPWRDPDHEAEVLEAGVLLEDLRVKPG